MTGHERLTLRSLYLYLVCLITLVISIFAAVGVVRDVVELAYPEPSYTLPPPEKAPGISAEDLRRQQEVAREAQQRQAVLGLVGTGTLLLIAGPLYAYHWRRVQAERPSRSPQPADGPPPAD